MILNFLSSKTFGFKHTKIKTTVVCKNSKWNLKSTSLILKNIIDNFFRFMLNLPNILLNYTNLFSSIYKFNYNINVDTFLKAFFEKVTVIKNHKSFTIHTCLLVIIRSKLFALNSIHAQMDLA